MADRRRRGAEEAAAAAEEYGKSTIELRVLLELCGKRTPEENVKALYAFFDEKGWVRNIFLHCVLFVSGILFLQSAFIK